MSRIGKSTEAVDWWLPRAVGKAGRKREQEDRGMTTKQYEVMKVF